MSRTDEQVDDILRRDASAELRRPYEVPNLHQGMSSVLLNSPRPAPRTKPWFRPAIIPLTAAAAAAVIIATPILLIQHNQPTHQAAPAATRSAAPSADPAISSSCAYGGVQASAGGRAPLSLLSCTGVAIGAYPGDNKLPSITVKVGDTVQISGAMLHQSSRLSSTPRKAADLTQTDVQHWRLVVHQAGRITVEVDSPGLCRNSQQPCGLLAVTVTP